MENNLMHTRLHGWAYRTLASCTTALQFHTALEVMELVKQRDPLTYELLKPLMEEKRAAVNYEQFNVEKLFT